MYWRLHERIFDDRLDEAVKVIQNLGDEYSLVKGLRSKQQQIRDIPAVALTSISDALYNCDCGSPWLYYDKEKYSVSHWLPMIHENALNPDTIFLPFGLLHELHKYFSGRVFIRPNSGNKTFTGCFASLDNPSEDVTAYNNSRIGSSAMCSISNAKDLPDYEYRFWIIDNKISTHSSYSHSKDEYIDVPSNAIDFVNSYLPASWAPDVGYTLDIVEYNETFKIVELNALSTSGIYNADLEKLFGDIRGIAYREFEGECFLT